MAVVTKNEEASNHDRDYICCIQTALEPISSKSMPYFIEWWNFRINFGNSMAKNHTARKQLCGSVQNSTNNMTTGKSIEANASRSTSTATLALLDIVNWTRPNHNVHWNQLILVDTFRLNFSKNHWGKEMLCLTPFQKFGNHPEPTKSACRNWYCSFIANECMQSHLEGSPNFIAWTYKKGRWPIKDKATRVMRHRRR